LDYAKRIVKLADPQSILDRGFAIVMHDGKICTDPEKLIVGKNISTQLKNTVLQSTIIDKIKL
jgi:exonuclease VII large subunit